MGRGYGGQLSNTCLNNCPARIAASSILRIFNRSSCMPASTKKKTFCLPYELSSGVEKPLQPFWPLPVGATHKTGEIPRGSLFSDITAQRPKSCEGFVLPLKSWGIDLSHEGTLLSIRIGKELRPSRGNLRMDVLLLTEFHHPIRHRW